MRYRFTNPFNPGRPLHSHRMLQLLEVTKLPHAGMPARMLPGVRLDAQGQKTPVEIRIWVAPFVPKFRPGWNGAPVRVKSSTHRVRCKCPGCGCELSAGRLFQHVCPGPVAAAPIAAEDYEPREPLCEHSWNG